MMTSDKRVTNSIDQPKEPAAETESALIKQTVADLERSQNERRADDFLRLFTPNAVWVTGFGRRLTGLNEISNFTKKVLGPADLGDWYAQYEVVHILFIRSDVSVVNVRQRYMNQDGAPLTDKGEGRPLYVMVKEQGRWMIAAGQNTPLHEAAIEQQRQEIEKK